MADPDIELNVEGRGDAFVLLALPAFLLSVISSCFAQTKGWPRAPPLDPSLQWTTGEAGVIQWLLLKPGNSN